MINNSKLIVEKIKETMNINGYNFDDEIYKMEHIKDISARSKGYYDHLAQSVMVYL